MADGFIKNYNLIQETSRVDDLLDFSKSVSDFSKRLESIDRPSLVGLIGKFGSGKSTMLYQIEKGRKDKETWILFDAWKYPERRGLWEGFVLDFADQVGSKKMARNRIAGRDPKSRSVEILGKIVSGVTQATAGIGNIGGLLELFKNSPATRVFEIQEILSEIIHRHKKDICIVVEDIDRSGDAGIYFLETLKEFIRKLNYDKRVITIVPISDFSYKGHHEEYHKCFDYVDFFCPQISGFDRFVGEIFKDNLFLGKDALRKGQVSSFCERLLDYEPMTVRLLKTMLRGADIAYRRQVSDGHQPEWLVTICFEAAKYIPSPNDQATPYIDSLRRERIVQRNIIFASLLGAILARRPSIYDRNSSPDKPQLFSPGLDFKLVPRNEPDGVKRYPSTPWHAQYTSENEKYFYLSDFYLNY